MFGGTLLEVAIGLAFVYLLLGLFCSVINEWIAALFARRPRNLRYAIEHLLSVSDTKLGDTPDVRAGSFFDHGLIKSLTFGGRNASYIPAERFAMTVFDLLAPAGGGDGLPKTVDEIRKAAVSLPAGHPLRKVLLPLIDQAGADLKRLRSAVEDWYNECMDRLTGVYKRWNMLILIVLACVIATVLNADTLMIAHVLGRDRTLRQSVVVAAESYVKAHPVTNPTVPGAAAAGSAPTVVPDPQRSATTKSGAADRSLADQIREVKEPLDGLGLPLRWQWAAREDEDGDPSLTPWGNRSHGAWWLWKIAGLFLTAAAVSLGAPFWFDVLNRFMNLRSSIKTDDDTDNKAVRRKTKPPASVTGTGGTGQATRSESGRQTGSFRGGRAPGHTAPERGNDVAVVPVAPDAHPDESAIRVE